MLGSEVSVSLWLQCHFPRPSLTLATVLSISQLALCTIAKIIFWKKKSIWSCQFALKLLLTPFFLQNTFQSPWYATQGPWWLAWPISQSVIFHTYISDYSSDRCQRDAENINISKLNWIHFDFLSFWLFSQSMDTSKSITIMRWRCIFIFVRKGSLIL